jgi:hypothetical protein
VLTDVLTGARALPRAEQFQLIQELAAGLLRDETSQIIESGREYSVWSPDAAFEAASILLRTLGDEPVQP